MTDYYAQSSTDPYIGSSSDLGTADDPWTGATVINAGIAANFGPGDRLLVYPGTFQDEQLTISSKNGSAGAPIILEAMQIDGQPTSLWDGTTQTTNNAFDLLNCRHYEIRGFSFNKIGYAGDATEVQCIRTRSRSGNLLIEDCSFSNLIESSQQKSRYGIDLRQVDANDSEDFVIRRNSFVQSDKCIRLYCQSSGSATFVRTLIEDCVMRDCWYGVGGFYQTPSDAGTRYWKDTTIRGCYIDRTHSSGIQVWGDNIDISHNVVNKLNYAHEVDSTLYPRSGQTANAIQTYRCRGGRIAYNRGAQYDANGAGGDHLLVILDFANSDPTLYSSDLRVHGNIMVNTDGTAGANTVACVSSFRANDCHIYGNLAIDCDTGFKHSWDSSSGVVFSHNTAINCPRGLYIKGDAAACTAHNNVFVDASGAAVFVLTGSTTPTFTGAMGIDSGTVALKVDGVTQSDPAGTFDADPNNSKPSASHPWPWPHGNFLGAGSPNAEPLTDVNGKLFAADPTVGASEVMHPDWLRFDKLSAMPLATFPVGTDDIVGEEVG